MWYQLFQNKRFQWNLLAWPLIIDSDKIQNWLCIVCSFGQLIGSILCRHYCPNTLIASEQTFSIQIHYNYCICRSLRSGFDITIFFIFSLVLHLKRFRIYYCWRLPLHFIDDLTIDIDINKHIFLSLLGSSSFVIRFNWFGWSIDCRRCVFCRCCQLPYKSFYFCSIDWN